jgi:hypothetical protein
MGFGAAATILGIEVYKAFPEARRQLDSRYTTNIDKLGILESRWAVESVMM